MTASVITRRKVLRLLALGLAHLACGACAPARKRRRIVCPYPM